MSINNDSNKSNGMKPEYRYSEDRLGKTKKRRNRGLNTALAVLGYLAALVIILYIIGLADQWITNKWSNSAKQMAVSAGAELMPEDEITLTQAEFNAKIEEAAAKAAEDAAIDAEAVREQALADAEISKEEAIAAARAEILDSLQAGLEDEENTVVEVIRPFYPDDIVAVSNGTFHFVPINRDLKMNSYNDENLNILESGEYQYMDGEQVISHKGIDVSYHQGNIDWNAVAQDGVEFAFIRVANRGYGTGKLVEDDNFKSNIEGAMAAGIHVGVYVYSQAITEDEVLEEANLVLQKLAPYAVKCPIVFDVEKAASESGRMNQLSVEERTNLTLLFCQTIEAAGYKPMIYHNLEMGALMLDIETLEQYDKWFAYYNDDMYYPYEYKIWQYSDEGKVNGIGSDVDLNICFEPFWE